MTRGPGDIGHARKPVIEVDNKGVTDKHQSQGKKSFLSLFQRFSVRKGEKKRKVRTYRSHVMNK